MDNNVLGDIIRKARGDLSLRDFAKKCNISHTHLDSIEKGYDPRTGKPVSLSLETLKKLSLGTGIKIEDLVGINEVVEFGNFISEASEEFNKGNGIEDIKLIYQLILNNKGKIYLIEQLILLLSAPVFLDDVNLNDQFDKTSIANYILKLTKVKDDLAKEGGK